MNTDFTKPVYMGVNTPFGEVDEKILKWAIIPAGTVAALLFLKKFRGKKRKRRK